MGIIILVVIFTILLVVSYKTLSQMGNFTGVPCGIISVCVALLAVIGMKDSLKSPIKTVLLPYAAFGISVLILMILWFIGKYLARTKAKEHFSIRAEKKILPAAKDDRRQR